LSKVLKAENDSVRTTSDNDSSIALSRHSILLINLAWIITSLTGATLGGLFIGAWIESSNDSFFQLFVLLTLSGIANGMLQIVVLRFDIRKSIHWILINSISWLAGGLVYLFTLWIFYILLYLLIGDPLSALSPLSRLIIVPITAGSAIGIFTISTTEHSVLIKWFGFDRHWDKTSIVAWILAWLIWLLIAFFAPGSEIITWIIGGSIAGIIYGLLTRKTIVQLIDNIKGH
jgi:hypothetical protein